MTLRPYQRLMVEYLLGLTRCNLFVPMGAGKTLATLVGIDALLLAGEVNRVLVLAPLRVARSTWPAEVKQWMPHLSIDFVGGPAEQRRAVLNTSRAVIHTINYELLPDLVEHWGERWPYDMVVADELTRLKSFRLRQGGQRAQALGRVAHRHVKRWVGLTGTPASNGVLDLWGQLWFTDAGQRLGRTFNAFQQRWFQSVPGGDGYQQVKPLPHAQTQIEDAIRDVCLSLDLREWFDIREPIVNDVYVDLPPKARKLYDDMEREMFAEIEGNPVEAFSAAARTMKCLQLANGAAYVDDTGKWSETHSAKIEALQSIVEEAAGMPVLVAYHFKSDLARLLKAFPKGRQLDKDPTTIEQWNRGEIPVLFAHPASAGHGLSLQHGGNIIAFFAHNWSLEERLQIIERIGPVRQLQSGYDRPVFIHNIIARRTVDELVMARVQTKREVQDLLMEAVKHRRQT